MQKIIALCFAAALCTQGASGQSVLSKLDCTGTMNYYVEQKDANPFGPAYALDFSLPDTCQVTVQVRRIDQTKTPDDQTATVPVRTLLSQSIPPGAYQIRWDTKDDSGRAVNGGLYIFFVRMVRSAGYNTVTFEVQSKRMLVY
jgi:hypothetical protein